MKWLSNGIETNPITNARVDRWEFSVRKLAHYGLFLMGGFILYSLLNCFGVSNQGLIAIFLGMLLACADEFHQFYSLNRGPRWLDVGLDTAGVITGVILAVMFAKVCNQGKKEKNV